MARQEDHQADKADQELFGKRMAILKRVWEALYHDPSQSDEVPMRSLYQAIVIAVKLRRYSIVSGGEGYEPEDLLAAIHEGHLCHLESKIWKKEKSRDRLVGMLIRIGSDSSTAEIISKIIDTMEWLEQAKQQLSQRQSSSIRKQLIEIFTGREVDGFLLRPDQINDNSYLQLLAKGCLPQAVLDRLQGKEQDSDSETFLETLESALEQHIAEQKGSDQAAAERAQAAPPSRSDCHGQHEAGASSQTPSSDTRPRS